MVEREEGGLAALTGVIEFRAVAGRAAIVHGAIFASILLRRRRGGKMAHRLSSLKDDVLLGTKTPERGNDPAVARFGVLSRTGWKTRPTFLPPAYFGGAGGGVAGAGGAGGAFTTSSNSTSNCSVAPPGMVGGWP